MPNITNLDGHPFRQPAWDLAGLMADAQAQAMQAHDPAETIFKAARAQGQPTRIIGPGMVNAARVGPPSTYEIDPLDIGYTYAGDVPDDTHPGTMGFDYGTLFMISRQPFIAAPFRVRIDQVAEFCKLPRSKYDLGIDVCLRDREKTPTRAQKKEMHAISNLILEAGGKYQKEGAGFETFMRMLVRDSLTYDQATSEILWNSARGRGIGSGQPAGFVIADAATIRRARPTQRALDAGRYDPEELAYVQVVNDEIVSEYGRDELIFGVRRPRSWLNVNGYGFPEIEEFISVVTSLINATTYNDVAFTNGVHVSTILAVKAKMNPKQWTNFQRTLKAYLTGVRNSHKTPAVLLDPDRKEEINAIQLGRGTNRDMEFSNWINWNLKLMLAVMGMDAAEIGIVFGNEGQASALNQQGPAERIVASKERSLRPLLRTVAAWLNRWVVWPLNPEFEFRFQGFDSVSEESRIAMDLKRGSAFMTVNEIRAEHDLPKLDSPAGDMVLNPTFLQAAQMGQQMAEGGLEEGGAGGGGSDEDFPVIPGGDQGNMEVAGAPFGKGWAWGYGRHGSFDDITRGIAERYEKMRDDGRIMRKGRYRRGKRWMPVESVPGCRTYVVEVD